MVAWSAAAVLGPAGGHLAGRSARPKGADRLPCADAGAVPAPVPDLRAPAAAVRPPPRPLRGPRRPRVRFWPRGGTRMGGGRSLPWTSLPRRRSCTSDHPCSELRSRPSKSRRLGRRLLDPLLEYAPTVKPAYPPCADDPGPMDRKSLVPPPAPKRSSLQNPPVL